ncbi:MAG: radical SAM protein [Bacteroidales bacterium]|jgi:wyosine [tRNA(Phe)-imidazoG37] synthetase (radical SAM superfamily)|nr:radical SAM protein [Bacteroidales bacterium]
MLREDIVFGPIHSRRLGASLGINLLPQKGKLCNFDCIYCECGWNKDGTGDKTIPKAEDLQSALEAKLKQCLKDNVLIDSITFSGDGEPTLNPDFAKIIDITISLRNRYYPEASVSVLSNATRIYKDDVFNALKKVDNPILKLDAPFDEAVARINRPQGEFHVQKIVNDLMRFEGNFILQTMFLKSDDFDSSDPVSLQAWMDIVRKLHPRKIMVYTIDRETPEKGLEKFTEDQMRLMVKPLVDDGLDVQING